MQLKERKRVGSRKPYPPGGALWNFPRVGKIFRRQFPAGRVSSYHFLMTTVEVLYRYATHPTEATMLGLNSAREVYGVRRIDFDREAQTVRVEYDATRLTAPTVFQLLRRAGLTVVEELPLIPPQPAEEPAQTTPAK